MMSGHSTRGRSVVFVGIRLPISLSQSAARVLTRVMPLTSAFPGCRKHAIRVNSARNAFRNYGAHERATVKLASAEEGKPSATTRTRSTRIGDPDDGAATGVRVRSADPHAHGGRYCAVRAHARRGGERLHRGNELTVLRHMLRLARRWGYLDQAPEIEVPKRPGGRLRYLELDEIAPCWPRAASRAIDTCSRSSRSPSRSRSTRRRTASRAACRSIARCTTRSPSFSPTRRSAVRACSSRSRTSAPGARIARRLPWPLSGRRSRGCQPSRRAWPPRAVRLQDAPAYAHLSPAHLRRAIEALDGFLPPFQHMLSI